MCVCVCRGDMPYCCCLPSSASHTHSAVLLPASSLTLNQLYSQYTHTHASAHTILHRYPLPPSISHTRTSLPAPVFIPQVRSQHLEVHSASEIRACAVHQAFGGADEAVQLCTGASSDPQQDRSWAQPHCCLLYVHQDLEPPRHLPPVH